MRAPQSVSRGLRNTCKNSSCILYEKRIGNSSSANSRGNRRVILGSSRLNTSSSASFAKAGTCRCSARVDSDSNSTSMIVTNCRFRNSNRFLTISSSFSGSTDTGDSNNTLSAVHFSTASVDLPLSYIGKAAATTAAGATPRVSTNVSVGLFVPRASRAPVSIAAATVSAALSEHWLKKNCSLYMSARDRSGVARENCYWFGCNHWSVVQSSYRTYHTRVRRSAALRAYSAYYSSRSSTDTRNEGCCSNATSFSSGGTGSRCRLIGNNCSAHSQTDSTGSNSTERGSGSRSSGDSAWSSSCFLKKRNNNCSSKAEYSSSSSRGDGSSCLESTSRLGGGCGPTVETVKSTTTRNNGCDSRINEGVTNSDTSKTTMDLKISAKFGEPQKSPFGIGVKEAAAIEELQLRAQRLCQDIDRGTLYMLKESLRQHQARVGLSSSHPAPEIAPATMQKIEKIVDKSMRLQAEVGKLLSYSHQNRRQMRKELLALGCTGLSTAVAAAIHPIFFLGTIVGLRSLMKARNVEEKREEGAKRLAEIKHEQNQLVQELNVLVGDLLAQVLHR